MKNSILILFLAALYSCSNNSKSNKISIKQKQNDSTINNLTKETVDDKKLSQIDTLQKPSQKQDSTEKSISKKTLKEDSLLYQYRNDTLTQTLTVKYLNENKIYFSLESINKDHSKTGNIRGYAVMPNGSQDTEEDQDENGVAYPSSEYVYHDKDCWLHIRIDADSKNKIQINKVKCISMSKYSPFYSVGILKYINSK